MKINISGQTLDLPTRALIGDRIAAATKAVGIKPCCGCKKRQQWLNDKHEKFRELIGKKNEERP